MSEPGVVLPDDCTSSAIALATESGSEAGREAEASATADPVALSFGSGFGLSQTTIFSAASIEAFFTTSTK